MQFSDPILPGKEAELINIDENFKDGLQKAERLYLEGTVFIYPTDTIYGFGANPFNSDAVNRIDEIKGREAGKFYILLIDSMENLLKYADVNSERHIDFLFKIWPNTISVVLNLNERTARLLGTGTAAFRIPNHRFCLKLLSKLKMPLISTSVNKSRNPPLIEPSVIVDEFSSEVDAIFYSDKKSFVEASTLIDLSGQKPVLLREGKIKFEDLIQKFN